MKANLEINGIEVVVVEETKDRGRFAVSVYSCKDGRTDYSDLLYTEEATSVQGAFAAFQKIKSALKKGKFPWEVEWEGSSGSDW